MKRHRVAIVGAGIAGLTAAHELVERDFDVDVYEHRFRAGGKAASVRVDLSKTKNLPGEHGFRFFPAWYQHVIDTMSRIPSDRHREHRQDHSVADHLVPVTSNLLASYSGDVIPIVLHAPRSIDQAQKLLSFVVQAQRLGLTLDEGVLFFSKLMEFLSIPDDQRRQKYDRIAWTAFIDLDSRSAAFRSLTAHTRSLVAAKATEASAYTIGTMAVRTLLTPTATLDRVLDGPTSEVWIEPWVRYLEGRGVKFHYGYDLTAVTFGSGEAMATGMRTATPLIKALRFSPIDQQYREAARGAGSADKAMSASEYADWRRERSRDDWPETLDEFRRLKLYDAPPRSDEYQDFSVFADHFVFAIPVEQMAYYINRTTMMTYHDESLRDVVKLAGSVDWMTGIQFYFRAPIDLPPGHIVCAESEWAITAIDQTQFWRDADVPRNVQSILSVDISAWDKKGRFNGKEAFRCTKDEIALEVWRELSASFNRGSATVLRPEMLIGGGLQGSFHLDDNVAERFDRAKQAEYERAQVVRFSADALLAEVPDDAPFVFGDRLEMNVEPILVNRPGTLALRPSARRERIPNMFLAADYVDTATNLACMEGANEGARRAVNAVLDQVGSRYDRCETWDFADHDVLSTLATVGRIVERGPAVRQSVEAATSAVSTLSALASRASQTLREKWKAR
jgi:uncharacterized protein with NAD-binding domain and iron-sulfur cluster